MDIPEGMYFVAASRLNGLVLTAPGDKSEDLKAGVELQLQPRDPANDRQVWYEDQVTGTIRSKANFDICITISGETGSLFVEDYREGSPTEQEWILAKDRVQAKHDHNVILLVTEANAEPGATVSKGTFNGENHQLWDFQYLPAEYFYIVSELHDKVVTVKHAETRPNGKIVMEPKREGSLEQLWHEGKHGFVRSRLNNFVLEAKRNENGASIRLMPFEPGNTNQLFCRHHNKIISLVHPSNIIGIRKHSKDNGAKLVICDDHNLPSQRWQWELLENKYL